MDISAILNAKGDGVFSVSPEETLQNTLQIFADKHIGCAPVTDNNGKLIGLISERDICRAIAEDGESAVRKPVQDVMRDKIISCHASDHQARVMALMTSHKTRHVMVLNEDGGIVGIISIGDIVKQRLDTALRDEKAMLNYISGTGYSLEAKRAS